jgi:hypothetical protein
VNVAILCTGEMELSGLARALKGLFPAHDFVTIGKFEAMPGRETEPLPEFASKKVDDNDALKPESVLRTQLVPRLAGALWEGTIGSFCYVTWSLPTWDEHRMCATS